MEEGIHYLSYSEGTKEGSTNMTIITRGDSMLPGIKNGEKWEIEKIEENEIHRGDIVVFYVHQENMIICHRVVDICHMHNGAVFLKTKGDNCRVSDPWAVSPEMVIGRIKRNQKRR